MIKIRNSILTGLAFGLILGIYLYYNYKTDVAIVVTVFCSIAFMILTYFRMFRKIDYSFTFRKIDKAAIVYSGLASHFVGDISVGGTLYVLKDELVFQTNAINFMFRHELVIGFNQITDVNFRDTMGFISNGLFVRTNDGKVAEFVVNNRDFWKEQIDKAMANPSI